MAKSNGGIIGALNPTSFGKCTQTIATSSTTVTTQPGTRVASYAVVAGGGGGGSGSGCGFAAGAGGGGGAGGFRTCASFSVCGATPYPITVGAGGVGGIYPSTQKGSSGTPSIFSTITSAGGGGAGAQDTGQQQGLNGGSGGGGGQTDAPGPFPNFGTGNTPPVSPSQGNPGGSGIDAPNFQAGGGGGASTAGTQATPSGGGPGGAGSSVTSLFGAAPQPFYGPTSGVYAGGGGGSGNGTAGTGGPGGGGNGSNSPTTGTAGTVNTGGGGGGSGGTGGAGASGIVIVQQPAFAIATGVWSLSEQYNFKKAGNWS